MNTILSGTEAYVFTKAECQRLQDFVVSKGRVLVAGAETIRDQHGNVTRRPTAERILYLVGVAPIEVEMRIRRLRMLAGMVRFEGDARMVNAAVFGRYSCDLGAAGTGSVIVDGSNPWAQQVY